MAEHNDAPTYTALTIDTNVFDDAGKDLRNELMRELLNLDAYHVRFVISEVVRREMADHLEQRISSEKKKVMNICSLSIIDNALTDERRSVLEKICKEIDENTDSAETQISRFLESAKAELIGVEEVLATDLIDMYFEAKPPFAGTGKKKSEFPDAIALKSLEEWSECNGCIILAVSNDKDWKTFAETSPVIDVVDSLPEALERLSDNASALRQKVDQLIRAIDSGEYPNVHESIEHALGSFDWANKVDFIVTSSFHYEETDKDLDYGGYQIVDEEDNTQFFIYRVDEDGFTVILQLVVVLDIYAGFDFFVAESTEMIDVGSANVSDSYLLPTTLFASIEVDGEEVSVAEILVNPGSDIDLGEIAPELDGTDLPVETP